MDKTKPSDVIAARYQISRESAKYFLIRVQKSFRLRACEDRHASRSLHSREQPGK